jgi:hypothetical protein
VQPNHYVVRDANKQQLAYVYYENEPGRRSAAKLLVSFPSMRCARIDPSGCVTRGQQVAGFASEIKRALNQGLIESATYDRGAIFFDAHLGPE